MPDTAPRTQAEADALHANAMATVSTALLVLETVTPDLRRLVANADWVMDVGSILDPTLFLTLTSAKGDSARRQIALAKAALAFVDCAREQFPLPKGEAA